MTEKLVIVIMGQNCEKFIGMCLESVKDADAIVYCDGGSNDDTLFLVNEELKGNNNNVIIENNYNQEDIGMNGKQRNFYLKYLKENYPDDWCLVLDADELVEDLSKIKKFLQTTGQNTYSVKMRHLIGDLGHEDATHQVHWVPNRLFKIKEAIGYPEHSHPILEIKGSSGTTDCTTIWHLGHLPVEYMDYILKRYKEHERDSIIHNPEFLKQWRNAHLFGRYPIRLINPLELPKQLTDRYEIDKDELYFESRRIFEAKHFMDAINWKYFFNPKRVLEFGCGFGQRLYCLNEIGIDTMGVEISKFAVDNGLKRDKMQLGDICHAKIDGSFDLVIAYDVLEHLEYDDLDKAIENMKNHTSKHILISIPVLGNPQLDADITHKIRETEEWWMEKFEKAGLKRIDTPNNFLYREQIYIFQK